MEAPLAARNAKVFIDDKDISSYCTGVSIFVDGMGVTRVRLEIVADIVKVLGEAEIEKVPS